MNLLAWSSKPHRNSLIANLIIIIFLVILLCVISFRLNFSQSLHPFHFWLWCIVIISLFVVWTFVWLIVTLWGVVVIIALLLVMVSLMRILLVSLSAISSGWSHILWCLCFVPAIINLNFLFSRISVVFILNFMRSFVKHMWPFCSIPLIYLLL